MAKSILQSEKECWVTGSTMNLDKHHIYAGARRNKSERYGCWVWLRHDVHMDLHERNQALGYELKALAQKRFEELYGHEKFMEVFGKNYIMEDTDE